MRSGREPRGPAPISCPCFSWLSASLCAQRLAHGLPGGPRYFTFVAAVVLSAGLYGVGPAILAIVLSLGIAIWTFTKPETGVPLGPDEVVIIGVFVVTSAAMLVFANHLRGVRRRALLLEMELRDVQSTAAMSTMASTLAHELNQPLTAASNYVAACKQYAERAEQANSTLLKGLGLADGQIQRAGSIIREARGLVRNVPVERKDARLKQLIEQVIEVARASDACAIVNFKVVIGTGVRRVHVNIVQIEQVLLNLVRNAAQAMRGIDQPSIVFEARRAENGSLIEVRDNGPGIPRDRLPGLFSASRGSAGSGLGVGLSISRTIVEAHGGSIMAQNSPEGGAAFLIFLPDDAEFS